MRPARFQPLNFAKNKKGGRPPPPKNQEQTSEREYDKYNKGLQNSFSGMPRPKFV
ncbi:MAG: hypothetical protein DHS20C02_19200 [Micavibrio sp.]|nr:MAG: hypothetical protein DHS20C02_19200 [Micavibrio sp.]